ncbi:mannose-6-Phosphate isomerase [Arthrobacter sp. Hiyo8]|nr:mannose-6-Phosphate isomerase [Arthrobacter sp. Hiyo8]
MLLSYAAYSGSHEHRAMASNILSLLPPIAGRAPRVAGWLLATAQAATVGPVEAAVSGPPGAKQRELHRALLASPSRGWWLRSSSVWPANKRPTTAPCPGPGSGT